MEISIVYTSDVHGHVFSHAYVDNKENYGGLTRLSSALGEWRKNQDILYIDNGDVLQGTPLNTFTNAHCQDSVMARAFNALGTSFYNVGNHDFNYGPEKLMRHLRQMQGHCLTCNVLYENEPIGSSIIIRHRNQTIGLIGVVTDYLDHWEKPENLVPFTILPVLETTKVEIKKLRDQVDKLIVVYHGGFERDLASGEPSEALTGENVGYELLMLPEIDVLLTGHQHRLIHELVNSTVVVQPGCMAQGCVCLNADLTMAQWVELSEFERDLEFEQLFEGEEAQTQQWLDKVIGEADCDLSIDDFFLAQLRKPLVIDFENQILMDIYQADMAFSALFNGSKGLNNPITLRGLSAFYPFPNTYDVVEMDKATLRAYLEQLAEYWTVCDDVIRVSQRFIEPKPQFYNYDMGSGLEYTMDISRPIGERITELRVPDKERFRVVLNNYRSGGGGDFLMIPKCRKLVSDSREAIDLLCEYIENHSPIQVVVQRNIKVVK